MNEPHHAEILWAELPFLFEKKSIRQVESGVLQIVFFSCYFYVRVWDADLHPILDLRGRIHLLSKMFAIPRVRQAIKVLCLNHIKYKLQPSQVPSFQSMFLDTKNITIVLTPEDSEPPKPA